MIVSDILDKKWFGGLYHLHNTEDTWQQWLQEFEPNYQYDTYVQEKLNKIFSRNLAYIKGQNVIDLACNLGYLSLAASNLGARTVIGLEVRQEFIDTFDKIAIYWPEKNVAVERCNIEDVESLRHYLNGANTVIYAGHFYHTANHLSILTTITTSGADCLILESTLIDHAQDQDFFYDIENTTINPLNGFLDDHTLLYKVAAPSLQKTKDLLIELGWTPQSCEIIQAARPRRFVITSTRTTQ